MHRILGRVAVLCIASSFLGCFGGKAGRKVSGEAAAQTEAVVDNEEVSPSSVAYTFLDTVNRGNELLLTDADFGRSGRNSVSDGTSGESITATRYRIQVLASTRIEAARVQKKELEKKIAEQVVIGYEAPYYKLFAGSFLKRQEAQALLMKLKKIGFIDAWIVSAKVSSEN
ncbi:MAG: SPOR domain-containing protein [Chitinispirillaceae bacterium]|nr:SPOR domain-containing protein [Chitinispirillaceae bacterium]